MNFRPFLNIFLLILLAELGDKTQLLALVSAASTRSPWTIFLGASAGLVVAMGISVLAGTYLEKALPLTAIQFFAGVIFIVFGALSIYRALNPSAAFLTKAATYEIQGPTMHSLGFLSRVTLQAALDFESSAINDYAQLATEANDPNVKNLFLWLSAEDGKHHKYINELFEKAHDLPSDGERLTEVVRPLPQSEGGATKLRDISLLKQSARHEATTMAFYGGLAESVRKKPQLANLFRKLALEEKNHLEKIHDLLRQLAS